MVDLRQRAPPRILAAKPVPIEFTFQKARAIADPDVIGCRITRIGLVDAAAFEHFRAKQGLERGQVGGDAILVLGLLETFGDKCILDFVLPRMAEPAPVDQHLV